MTITLFGATGMVGKYIIQLALYKGFTVKAYGRNVHTLIDAMEANDNLKLIKGGMFDKGDIADAITGSHAVLSTLGGAIDGTDATRSLGMKYIVEAMQAQHVSRIIAIGGIGCLQATNDVLVGDTEQFPEEYKAVNQEHLKALSYLQESTLSWTFVCPPTIIDAPVTGSYVTQANYPSTTGHTITAGDLAHCMLTNITNTNYLYTKVGISNEA